MTINFIWTLTGGEFQAGNAIDNTQTDQFQVYGSGNIIETIGGNLIVNGGSLAPFGQDTATTIFQGTSFGVTDQITLDGGGNTLDGLGSLFGSTVTYTVKGGGGANSVSLNNFGGTTTLSLGGPGNTVILNGDAANKITSTGGGASVSVGSSDDNLFGNSTSIYLGGTGNKVSGGDEDFLVKGGQGRVVLGDGTNSVILGGGGNNVTVGGGNNTINAGGSTATVNIVGVDGTNGPVYAPDIFDGPVPPSPTDYVTIAGTKDKVTATYENVIIFGTAVTSAATISLGDGNNAIILGGTGGNTVTVGNGANSINATGSSSSYKLGDGPNGVTLSGNSNLVSVTDPAGVGLDKVQLGAGQNNKVSLDHAAGSVAGTATVGTTRVTQTGHNAVTVNLNNGTVPSRSAMAMIALPPTELAASSPPATAQTPWSPTAAVTRSRSATAMILSPPMATLIRSPLATAMMLSPPMAAATS